MGSRRTPLDPRVSEDSYDFVSISGARRPSMRLTEGNVSINGEDPRVAGPGAAGRVSHRTSMRATEGYVPIVEVETGRALSGTNRRRPFMRATEGNVDLSDDHIERHIARTLAVAASRRRSHVFQVSSV